MYKIINNSNKKNKANTTDTMWVESLFTRTKHSKTNGNLFPEAWSGFPLSSHL